MTTPKKLAGQEIVDVDQKKLLTMLERALADEWTAYYQYWVYERLARGFDRDAVVEEFEEHAMEELDHAQRLATRIVQLGGSIQQTLKLITQTAGCSYESKKLPVSLSSLLDEAIRGEQCAINFYHQILAFVEGKDAVTQDLITSIITDEVNHEYELVMLLDKK